MMANVTLTDTEQARIHGTPGGLLKLNGGKYGSKADAGITGEERTAPTLNALAKEGVHVFHSMKIPNWSSGDLDHGYLSRRRWQMVDTKVRHAGVLRGFGGKVWYGWKFWEIDKGLSPKKSLEAAAEFRKLGLKVPKPIILIHGNVELKILTGGGARYMTAAQFKDFLAKESHKPSDSAFLEELIALTSATSVITSVTRKSVA
jgi:hypothetical protein